MLQKGIGNMDRAGKKRHKNSFKENLKSFLIGFLVVLVCLLINHIRNEKYSKMEDYLKNNYYSTDHLYEAMDNTLGDSADRYDDKKQYISENFDNYVFKLVLSDLNEQEDEHKSKYNNYFNKERAEDILNQIDSSNKVVVNSENGICYIKISDFTYNKTFKDIFSYKSILSESNNFIIDLRGNIGGSITELKDVLSLFYTEGNVIYTEVKSDEIRSYKTTASKIIDFDKIVFLCDENTASAAEVMIFNMKSDFTDKVTIVGSQTFGKNFGYAYKQFKDGELFMFVSEMMGNSKGETFDDTGITPDFTLDDSTDSLDFAKKIFSENGVTE